jgi:hypothetical protein
MLKPSDRFLKKIFSPEKMAKKKKGNTKTTNKSGDGPLSKMVSKSSRY